MGLPAFEQLDATGKSLEQQLREANRVIANFRGENPEMVVVQEYVFKLMMNNAILWQEHIAAQPEAPVQDRIENGHGV